MHARSARLASILWLVCAGCDSSGAPDGMSEPVAQPDAGADSGANLGLPWPADRLGPAPYPDDNPPTEAKRLLGRALFYDPVVSSDKATACVSCHSEIWGLSDQLARSVGVDGTGPIGPGRKGPNMTRRNSQALWNLAYRKEFFWDGRADSLEHQVFFPIESAEELNRKPSELVAELAANPQYQMLFQAAFPGVEPAVTEQTFSQALGVFMRAYISDRAPYDSYLKGDMRALDAQDLRGASLFAALGCHGCHLPPRFESDQYHDRQVPNPENIVDDGRFEFSGEAADRGTFRVPTLRNARESGPYFHNGSVRTFEEAVAHEVDLQVASGARGALTGDEFDDLMSFLRRSLTDVSREQHPPKSVPSGLPIPLDGDLLLRGGHGD
ncbi:MAG: cytochrome c peroxidase [Myxococcales bacterium]